MEFVLRVILSFVVGGGYVSGIIWLSEKLGSSIGGALAGVPNTLLIGLIFINITEGPESTKVATAIVPVMLATTLFYTWVFIKVSSLTKLSRYLFLSVIATMAWLVTSAILRESLSKTGFSYIVILGLAGILLFQYALHKYAVVVAKTRILPSSVYLARFLVSGAVIASAVVVARYSGPLWGGVVSSFPATVATALYFLSKSQGSEFVKSFVKRLPLAVISSLLFVIVLHQTLTRLPTITCFLLGMSCSLICTLILLSIKKPQTLVQSLSEGE
ncbi:MAG TPA: hypothetical protein VNG32_01445 [Candidatus Dormibacteraeota bacterium]|nr:hypothetical protein [Candidatus Dormibacteraeota bacterium]